MANFLKKIFQKKKSDVALPNDTIRQGEPQILKVNINKSQSNDEEILNFFLTNKPLLHKVFVPILKFTNDINISPRTFCRLVKQGYDSATLINTLSGIDKRITIYNAREKEELIKNLNCQYDWHISKQIADTLFDQNLSNLFFSLYNCTLDEIKNFEDSLVNIWHQNLNTEYFIECFIESQIELSFLKLFAFEKEIRKIKENEELSKILTNATYKFQDVELISTKTYDIFLEQLNLSNKDFANQNYTELVEIFIALEQKCKDFYSTDELTLNFDVNVLTIEEILHTIIEEKIYETYEIDKLLLSIIYEKTSSFNNLDTFVKTLNELDQYSKKIKNIQLKNDLLNNVYEKNRTAIVDIDLMSGIEFEEFLCNYFNEHGYECKTTKASGDQGVDLIATRNGTTLAIQAKCYEGTVGNHAIMEVVAGTKYYNADQSMVITNSTFTKSAIELAKANGVILWDRQVLIEKLANN